MTNKSLETVDLVGIKNGVETYLGTIPMPPSMKLKEIMRTYFSGSTDDEESEVSMAVAAGMELLAWMEAQGFQQRPQAAGDETATIISSQEWADAYAAFVGAFDTPLARRQIDNEFAQDARRRLSALNERLKDRATQSSIKIQ